MPKDAAESKKAFRELIRLLEEAVKAGANCLELEWEERELVVYQYSGATGIGAVAIPKELQVAVLRAIVKTAKLTRQPTGRMLLTLMGQEYDVFVRQYDNYGEAAFTLRLNKGKKRGK